MPPYIRLNENFEDYPDIVAPIAGLAAEEDKAGPYYEYYGMRLEELDRDTLYGILRTAEQRISLRSGEGPEEQVEAPEEMEGIEDLTPIKSDVIRPF